MPGNGRVAEAGCGMAIDEPSSLKQRDWRGLGGGRPQGHHLEWQVAVELLGVTGEVLNVSGVACSTESHPRVLRRLDVP